MRQEAMHKLLDAELSTANLPREDLWRFLEALESKKQIAAQTMKRRLFGIVLIWGLGVGVAESVVAGGSIASFDIKDASVVLLIAPLLVGLFFHDAAVAVSLESIVGRLARVCHRHLNPQLSDHGRLVLTTDVDFISGEDLLIRRGRGAVGNVVLGSTLAGVAFLVLGPIAAAVHLSFLVFTATKATLWLKIVMVSLAGIITLRGAFVAIALDVWS